MTQAYIVDALRTAGGRRGGALKDWHPADLGAVVLDARPPTAICQGPETSEPRQPKLPGFHDSHPKI